MDDMRELAAKLEPDAISTSLVRAALFLAGWELLIGEVVTKVQDFYCDGFDGKGLTTSPDYASRVLSRHKSRFEASLLWLVEASALTAEQADRIRAIHVHRNEVAHELPKLLVDPSYSVNRDLLAEIEGLLAALGRFWGHIAADADPAFDEVEVRDEDIKSGSMLLMEHLLRATDALQVRGQGSVAEENKWKSRPSHEST